MFDGKYFEWNQKRIKNIIDFYGFKFFYLKRVLDLGCGHGDVGGALYRLGADVTGIDARQEHLKVLGKKYPGIKTIQNNLDSKWPFHGQKFDLILDLGLLCHLADFEKHLKEVCASTTHLVLETAVCDSEDPNKVVNIIENKSIYDLSYNGTGCRPSAAAIERVLKNCGMNFKRVDNAKYNTDTYKYDWYPTNDNNTNIEKRRIWFAVRDNSLVQFANPNSEIAMPPISLPPSPQGYVAPIVDSGVPVMTTASPKPIMSFRMQAEQPTQQIVSPPGLISPVVINPSIPFSHSMPAPSPIRTTRKSLSLNEKVRVDSKQFGLITPDNFAAPIQSDMKFVFSPNTHSSRLWYKKISPFFNNFRVSNKVLTMTGFQKSDSIPDVIMCSLDNLQSHSRVWIDEWVSPGLTDEHISVLSKCHAIITPSIINAQEIWKYIPNSNIFRIEKPWPALECSPADGNYFMYFEKSSELTNILLQSWNEGWGNLVVVGSSIRLPPFATYVSDTESYFQIMRFILGAKGIIDLSENNSYDSGIIKMAYAIGCPIISNNHTKLSNKDTALGQNFTLVHQDKRVSLLPTPDMVRHAIQKFSENHHTKPSISGMGNYNSMIINDIKKIVGL